MINADTLKKINQLNNRLLKIQTVLENSNVTYCNHFIITPEYSAELDDKSLYAQAIVPKEILIPVLDEYCGLLRHKLKSLGYEA